MSEQSTHKVVFKNEFLTVNEIADYFRVTRITVWRWCKRGIIPALQIGRTWRIPRDEFLEFETKLRKRCRSLSNAWLDKLALDESLDDQ